MGQLEDMAIFIRVVEAGSITQAAEQLNIAKSAISKRLSALEKKLSTKLINRTTRKISITQAGQHFYQRSKLILDEVDELTNDTHCNQRDLSGSLSITVPLSFGLRYLSEPLAKFMGLHPQLNLHVNFSDQTLDLIEMGFDLAIRIGQINSATIQGRKLAEVNHVVCASPEYLVKYGTPQTPNDLKHHKFLKYGKHHSNTLIFTDNQQQIHQVQPPIYSIANNGDFLTKLAELGHGITFQPQFIIWESIKEKRLIPILQNYHLPNIPAYAVYPNNRHLPEKVRTLIDFLVEELKELPCW